MAPSRLETTLSGATENIICALAAIIGTSPRNSAAIPTRVDHCVFTGLATSIDGQTGTGYDFADFLLGVPQQTSIQYSPSQYNFVSNGWDAYVNDDWRIAANLTLELGLRYEYAGPFTETNNRIVNLDPNSNFTSVMPVEPGQNGYPT